MRCSEEVFDIIETRQIRLPAIFYYSLIFTYHLWDLRYNSFAHAIYLSNDI